MAPHFTASYRAVNLLSACSGFNALAGFDSEPTHHLPPTKNSRYHMAHDFFPWPSSLQQAPLLARISIHLPENRSLYILFLLNLRAYRSFIVGDSCIGK